MAENEHIFRRGEPPTTSVFIQPLSTGSGIEFTAIKYVTWCELTYQLQRKDASMGDFVTVRECTFDGGGTLRNGKCPEWPQASNPLTELFPPDTQWRIRVYNREECSNNGIKFLDSTYCHLERSPPPPPLNPRPSPPPPSPPPPGSPPHPPHTPPLLPPSPTAPPPLVPSCLLGFEVAESDEGFVARADASNPNHAPSTNRCLNP